MSGVVCCGEVGSSNPLVMEDSTTVYSIPFISHDVKSPLRMDGLLESHMGFVGPPGIHL